MATAKEKSEELQRLEERKVKSLEKIANSLDALTVWFEEIDKDTWGSRIEWYLHLIGTKYLKDVMQEEKNE
jgi:hypothetical protein